MTTYNTGNSVPSTAVKDLYDNSQTEDEFVNSDATTTITRTGKVIKTIEGFTQDVNAVLIAAGYEYIGDYDAPGELTFIRYNQIMRKDGEFWKPAASLTLPYTTVNNWVTDQPKFRSVGDAVLRQDLESLTGAGLVGYDESLTYPADTVGSELDRVKGPGFKKQQRTFSDFEMISNLGNVSRLNAAIVEGTVRVCFVGDSITEGDRDSLYDNAAPALVMRALREQNKNTTFVFGNFSLAGRGIATYSDPNYKGIAGPDDPVTGFYRAAGAAVTSLWPGGSVIGKSWADHVKDFTPDLVVFLFGANDLSANGGLIAGMWNTALNYVNTWTKIPSVAMATTAQTAVAAGFQVETQIAADVVRWVAREKNHTLLDINRLFKMHREAVDIDNLFYTRDDNFPAYPTNWTPDAGSTLALADAGITLTGTGGATRNLTSRDINIAARFTMPNWATTVGILRYRDIGSPLTRYMAYVTSGGLLLYYGATIIANVTISAIPNGTEVTLQVDVRGAWHRVYLNNVLLITLYDYNNLLPGKHGVQIAAGSGSVYGLSAHLGNLYAVGIPELTDQDIYGISSVEFASNPNSLGGNGINHPTKLGNTVIWAAGYIPLIRHIRTIKAPDPLNYNVSVGLSAPQAIATGGATDILWTLENYDAYGMHTPGAANIVMPVTGKYQINASIYWAATATGVRSMLLVKGGATEVAGDTRSATATGRVRQNLAVELLLNAGETLALRGFQDGAPLLNADSDGTRMSVRLMPN